MYMDKACKLTIKQQTKGLVQALNILCEHGSHRNCGKFPDRMYLIFPLAIGDLSGYLSTKTELRTFIAMIQGPLQGLAALHRAGFMHRDVTLRNILILSIKPPLCDLCDYGKALKHPVSNDSRIGPIPTLAPEVDRDNIKFYDNKIDIWGIGYVCARMLFNAYMVKNVNNRKRPDEIWHQAIMSQLARYAKSGPLESSFADLVRKMLAWNPKDRPTAIQALQHSCIRESASESTSSSSSHSSPKAPHNNKAPRLTQSNNHSIEYNSGDTEIAAPGALDRQASIPQS